MKKPAAEPATEPQAEYPKMLYVGPYRQQVTVYTADEEAQWAKAHDEQMGGAAQPLTGASSVPGVTVLGAAVDDAADMSDDDEPSGKSTKKGKR